MPSEIDRETLVKARKYAAKLYREKLEQSEYQYCHESFAARDALEETGKHFQFGHGVEGFSWNCGRNGVEYINTGDTYSATILFDSSTERFSIGCYGDTVEQLERQGIEID